MSDRNWFIYTLSDPRTGEVRYIGFATRLKRRFIEHISAARERTYKANWIKSLLKQDLRPMLAVLEEGCGSLWAEREQFWIAHYRSAGARLTNMTDGGDGALGVVRSSETCAKLRAALTGKKRPREVVERWLATKKLNGPSDRQIAALRTMSAANCGHKQSPEASRKKSAAMTGKKLIWSAEAKAAAKGKNKGITRSAETRARMSTASRSRPPMSAETKAKISAARIGITISVEHRAKLSTALKGRIMTAEHKEKIRLALLARRQRD